MNYVYVAILIGVSVIAGFFYFMSRRQKIVRKLIEEKIQGQTVIMPTEHVIFRAVESSEYSQTRGMGFIALTEEFLYFELVLLKLEITVPTNKLKGAERVGQLKGVSPGRNMLLIKFTNEKGKDDSMAINVIDKDQWIKAITKVSKK
ncbi:MAG: hypothetical protein HRT89_06155 [Lentisphaeria bacterium]|nr:hypothetical protein [Lentisphaeria bacterium]NQZ67635.1 hypothetical protein [Lentisphaeria bacterium]